MQQFAGKVAVVTGAASGIGKALAKHCLKQGMSVVLADIDQTSLNQVVKEFHAIGTNNVIGVHTDVARREDVEALAAQTLSAFGGVHLLFNNAGVASTSGMLGTTLEDWDWLISVNLWSVIYGMHVFTPIMIEQDCECHIVNTSSVMGLLPGSASASYSVVKHGVVALTEATHFELMGMGAKVGASVLCPGFIDTNIMDAQKTELVTDEVRLRRAALRAQIAVGMAPETVAEIAFAGICKRQLYILTDDHFNESIELRAKHITAAS